MTDSMPLFHIGVVAMCMPICAIASPMLCKFSERNQETIIHYVSRWGVVSIAALWIAKF